VEEDAGLAPLELDAAKNIAAACDKIDEYGTTSDGE
jgi:hypothetical protein